MLFLLRGRCYIIDTLKFRLIGFESLGFLGFWGFAKRVLVLRTGLYKLFFNFGGSTALLLSFFTS